MIELTDKVVFHMVIPNQKTWYSEEQLQGTRYMKGRQGDNYSNLR